MHRATTGGLLEVVKYMLSKSTSQPKRSQVTDETPLLIACRKSLHVIAAALLDHSPGLVFITKAFNKLSPLHLACSRGDVEMVKLILQAIRKLIELNIESEVSLDFRDQLECTPLYNACHHGSFDVVKLLVEFQRENCMKVSFNINSAIKGSQRTPLHAAVQKGCLDIVQLLLTVKDIDINVKGRPSRRTQNMLIQNYKKSHAKDASIVKKEEIGCIEKNPEFVENPPECIQSASEFIRDIPVKTPNSRSQTVVVTKKSPIDISSSSDNATPVEIKKRSQTDIDMASNLKEQILEDPKTGKLDIRVKGTEVSNWKNFDHLFLSPLTEACACCHEEIMEVLLLQGARDDHGLACRIAHLIQRPDLVRLILSFHTVLKENLQVGRGGHLGGMDEDSIPHLELDWSHLKLPHCEGEWLGAEAEFYLLSGDLQDRELAEDSFILVNGLGNPLRTRPERTMQFDVVCAVNLEKNQLLSVPIELFQLQNVYKINLSNNRLTRLPTQPLKSTTFAPTTGSVNADGWACPCLMELMLSYNELTHLPGSVWGLPNITKLLCSKNRLETLLPEEGTISEEILSRTLEDVDISSNSLKDEVSQFLFELPSLRKLDLSVNMIVDLPETLWGCVTLQDLNMSSNKLTSLPQCKPEQENHNSSINRSGSRAVQHGSVLLGGRAVMKPAENAPRTCRTLSTIQPNTGLGMSSVSSTAEHYNYSSLHKLNLSKNNFSQFPEALACFAPNVTDLDVSRNPLEDLDVQFLPPFLKKLTAKRCEIRRLGNTISKKHQVRITKNCQHSSSVELACLHRSHTHLPYLTTIDLSMNKLTHIQLTRQQPTDDKNVNFGRMETEYNHKIVPAMDLLYPSLQNLYLTGNCLEGKFNPNIGHQYNLKAIQLSSNEPLTYIPMEFSYLNRKHFTEFKIEDLPNLRDPPPSYQKAKLNHLLTYMRSRVKE